MYSSYWKYQCHSFFMIPFLHASFLFLLSIAFTCVSLCYPSLRFLHFPSCTCKKGWAKRIMYAFCLIYVLTLEGTVPLEGTHPHRQTLFGSLNHDRPTICLKHWWFNSFRRYPTIPSLNLKGNALREVPSEISKMSSLTELLLDDNRITEIDANLCSIQSLTTLQLVNNKVGVLPTSMFKLTNLKNLGLSSNKFISWPTGELISQHSCHQLSIAWSIRALTLRNEQWASGFDENMRYCLVICTM